VLTLALLVSLSTTPHAEGPKNGSPIEVDYQVGDVTLTVTGRLVPCTQGKRCAQLPNGKRLVGQVKAGRFVVEESP